MMADHDIDEGAQVLSQQARMAMMIAGRMVEMAARRRVDQDRAATDDARDRANAASRQADRLDRQDRSATREMSRVGVKEQDRARQAAPQVYGPLTNPRTFAAAEPETVAAGYTLAKVWEQSDPRAATAVEQIDGLCEDRWGVPARRLTHGMGSQNEQDGQPRTAAREAPRDMLERARDERWRERGSSEDLAAAWQAASAAGDTRTREALETTMGTRFEVDVEDYLRQVRQGQENQAVPGDVAWLATQNQSDLVQARRENGRADNEQAMVGRFDQDLAEERTNDPAGERFNAKSDTGVQDTSALQAGRAEATGEAARHHIAADAAAAQAAPGSRVDLDAMRANNVPPAAVEARLRTAPAFGTRTVDGVRDANQKSAPKAGTRTRAPVKSQDRGRF